MQSSREPLRFSRGRSSGKGYDPEEPHTFQEDPDNYKSCRDNVAAIEAQFRKEEQAHLMREEPDEVALAEYGEDLTIAAQAAIVKSDLSFRVIRDGTHRSGVKDPAARSGEDAGHAGAKAILARARRHGGVVFRCIATKAFVGLGKQTQFK